MVPNVKNLNFLHIFFKKCSLHRGFRARPPAAALIIRRRRVNYPPRAVLKIIKMAKKIELRKSTNTKEYKVYMQMSIKFTYKRV